MRSSAKNRRHLFYRKRHRPHGRLPLFSRTLFINDRKGDLPTKRSLALLRATRREVTHTHLLYTRRTSTATRTRVHTPRCARRFSLSDPRTRRALTRRRRARATQDVLKLEPLRLDVKLLEDRIRPELGADGEGDHRGTR